MCYVLQFLKVENFFCLSELILFCIMQGIEATVVSGNGTETGQIIATTVVGRNGQQKQVI